MTLREWISSYVIGTPGDLDGKDLPESVSATYWNGEQVLRVAGRAVCWREMESLWRWGVFGLTDHESAFMDAPVRMP